MNYNFLKPTFLAVALALCSSELQAQLGHNNPTGDTGQFNGNVTTAGSYDPYTANATRSITDIVVPGTIGTYPLAFTRTMNTRPEPSTRGYHFGWAGAWRHSYQWEIPGQYYETTDDEYPVPPSYLVRYPDGRAVTFAPDTSTGDPFYRSGIPGVRERFTPIDNPSADYGECRLLLPDGGVVSFTWNAARGVLIDPHTGEKTGYWTRFTFLFAGITDPYGQQTSVERGHAPDYQLQRINAPHNHRSLEITYTTVNDEKVIDYVTEWFGSTPGRRVNYEYEVFQSGSVSRAALQSVEYFSDATHAADSELTARYTYQVSNAGDAYRPLIATCDDSMFDGPMSEISYAFVDGGAHGQIESEKHLSGTAVSTLTVTGNTRTESTGDSRSRTFEYEDGLLKSWTDFKGVESFQDHVGGMISHVIDGRENRTDFTRDPWTGNITLVQHPPTPSDDMTRKTVQSSYLATCDQDPFNCDANEPYYLYKTTNERNHSTIFLRDDHHRVREILYPDDSSEGFLYNNFGQVTRHRRKNGFYEHFEYNNRGLLIHRWNPVASESRPAGNEPKTVISYYPLNHPWRDRVQSETDPRGKTTIFSYEVSPSGAPRPGRGLASSIEFPRTSSCSDCQPPTKSFTYDRWGNVKRETNEAGEPVEYDYDEYNRLERRRTPRPSPTDPNVVDPANPWHSDTYDYRVTDNGNPYVRTAAAVTKRTTAAGLVETRGYDPNLMLEKLTQSNPDGDDAVTDYHYDDAGNLDWIIDPRRHKTTMDYDQRDRKRIAITPEVTLADGTTTQYTTEWLYDPTGNIAKVIHPDGKTVEHKYDEMNRISHSWDQERRLTTSKYHFSGMLKELLDPKQQLTSFEYNERDLVKSKTYPDRTTVVSGWKYDDNGNLVERPSIGSGPKQLFSYDSRNRMETMRWSNAIDYADFQYDSAGRLTGASNPYSTITRDYDVAGRLILDRQHVASVVNTLPATITPASVVSRKFHGSAGNFDIDLPLTGQAGIESRSGGASQDYMVVLTFSSEVTAVGGATVGSGFARVGTVGIGADGYSVTVYLTGVSNTQRLTVNVYGISAGGVTGDVTIPMNVIVGDVNADGVVNDTDKDMTQAQSGNAASASNFKTDANCNGAINATDISLVKAHAGKTVAFSPGYTVDVSYRRDGDDRVKKLFVPGVNGGYSYEYTYDGIGRLEKVFQSGDSNPHYQYTYDRASNVTKRMNFLNDTAQTFIPDEINRIRERTIQAAWYEAYPNGRHNYDFSREVYGYDRMNRLQTMDRTLRSSNGAVEIRRNVFGYNFAGELKSAEYDRAPDGQGGFGPASRWVTYNLDDAGNRHGNDGVNNNGSWINYEPDVLNQYTSVGGSNNVANSAHHQVAGYENISYAYLADTLLASASRSINDRYELGYDALGRCVRRTTNGQPEYYAYDGVRAILEYNPANSTSTIRNVYGIGIDEVILRNAGSPYFLQQDRLGSTSAATTSTGEVTEQYLYDAFGAPEIRSGPTENNPRGSLRATGTLINNRFLFTGREWVQRYGFYEYRARAYHPGLGRFMSEDPIGFAAGDTNLFRYCGGDPVNKTDPSGTQDGANPFPPAGYGGFQHPSQAYGPSGLPSGYYGPNSPLGNTQGVTLGNYGPDVITPFAVATVGVSAGAAVVVYGGPVVASNAGLAVYYAHVAAQKAPAAYQIYRRYSPIWKGLKDSLGLNFVSIGGRAFGFATPNNRSIGVPIPPSGNWRYGGDDAPPGSITAEIDGEPVFKAVPAKASPFGSIFRGGETSGGYPVGLPAGYSNMGFAQGGGGWITKALLGH
jgi:RHS repeat-associated protein